MRWGNAVGIFVLALPAPRTGIVAWLQKHFFITWYDGVFSIIFAVLIFCGLQSLLGWAFLDAIWQVEDRDLCTSESRAGWAVIERHGRLILFGLDPFDQQWRSTLACLVIIVTIVLSCLPAFWTFRRLPLLWIASFATFVLLMRGGFAVFFAAFATPYPQSSTRRESPSRRRPS